MLFFQNAVYHGFLLATVSWMHIYYCTKIRGYWTNSILQMKFLLVSYVTTLKSPKCVIGYVRFIFLEEISDRELLLTFRQITYALVE